MCVNSNKNKMSVIKCFELIYAIQIFLGSSRINIKRGVISDATKYQKIYTLLCTISASCSFYYFETQFYKIYKDIEPTLYLAYVVVVVIQYIAYIVTVVHIRFFRTSLVIRILHRMQEIDEVIMHNDDSIKIFQYYCNIVGLVLISVSFMCGFLTYVVQMVENPILTTFAGLSFLVIYIDLLFAGSLLNYLTLLLKQLNSENNIENLFTMPSQLINTLYYEKIIRTEFNHSQKFHLLYLKCLKDLIDVYEMVNEVYRFPIVNLVATMYFWTLFVIAAMVIGLHSELVSTASIIVISLWIIFYFILLTSLAIVNESFLAEIKQIKLRCIYFMSYCFDGPVREEAVIVLRVIEFREPVFSIYGIFLLDQSLPLKLIGVITTNVVVLIQFAINKI